jgi:hypothetical protein
MSKRKPFKVKPVKIIGVTITRPGIYTLDELRQTQTDIAKQLWPTIRTDEEAELRIKEWLIRTKHLDDYSIRRLPLFTVLRWLEEELVKASGTLPPGQAPHPYKLYFAKWAASNPTVRYKEAEAAKAYWNIAIDKAEKSKLSLGKTKEEALRSFIRRFKHILKK